MQSRFSSRNFNRRKRYENFNRIISSCVHTSTKIKKPPSYIEGSYITDYNILETHQIMVNKFKWEQNVLVNKLENKITDTKQKLKEQLRIIYRKKLQREITEMEEEIKDIKSGQKFKEYLARTKDVLATYQSLGPKKDVILFTSDKINTPEESPDTDSNREKRLAAISKYLDIIKDYIDVYVFRNFPEGIYCDSCLHKLEDKDMDHDKEMYVCPQCYTGKLDLISTPYSKDIIKSNCSKNGYQDRLNFERAYLGLQGKQSTKPEHLIPILDKYFREKGLPSSEEIKKLPLNKKGMKKGTSRELMFSALSETGNPGFYSNINWICRVYWGWKLPDYSYLDGIIMYFYDKTQEIYNSIKKNRESSLNLPYRLYRTLKYLVSKSSISDAVINKEDFKLPITAETLEWHDKMFDRIIEIFEEKYGDISQQVP